MQVITCLQPYEFELLLNALRRDLRVQEELAVHSDEWSAYHANEARYVKRLLEALNPKHGHGSCKAEHAALAITTRKPVALGNIAGE